MTTLQFLMVGAAAFLMFTSFDLKPAFEVLKSMFYKLIPSKATAKEGLSVVYDENSESDKDDLIDIVRKWDSLRDACEKSGLNDAVVKLDEIFPVLIKVEKPEKVAE